VWIVQQGLGLLCYLFIVLPFCRRVHGKLPPKSERSLFIMNHVSLLDTLMLGGVLWSRRTLPFIVLGDQATWSKSALLKCLSWKVGYLLDREAVTKERIAQLKAFGRAKEGFHLAIFPEGTRGNGVELNPFQPGVYFIAKEARAPIVPVFIKNMQQISTKGGRVYPIRGFRKVELFFGERIDPSEYQELRREEFMELIFGAMEKLMNENL
jgi:1-acyl-sn-glycerol-3-phosphate acyltransferase